MRKRNADGVALKFLFCVFYSIFYQFHGVSMIIGSVYAPVPWYIFGELYPASFAASSTILCAVSVSPRFTASRYSVSRSVGVYE